MTIKTIGLVLVIALAAVLIVQKMAYTPHLCRAPIPNTTEINLIENPRTIGQKIVNGAKVEVQRGVHYNAAYVRIKYPGGDVPEDQGACTDVIVRALRNAGYDLQKLVHEDMSKSFGSYPQSYGLSRPDSNIDHRRVPNLMTFLRRHCRELPKATVGRPRDSWQPGDLIFWKLDYGADHCGVLSNDRNADGLPLVIHNLGQACQEDCLIRWRITGHFRFLPGSNH